MISNPFPNGNQFWKARSKHGVDKIFSTPHDLWVSCCEYFQWVDDNPLYEEKAIPYKGEVTYAAVTKMRAMTIKGLCTFLGVSHETWRQYRLREEFKETCSAVKDIIYQQKFTGAAADLLNQSIIARELGLKDKKEHALTGGDGGPITKVNLDREQYAEIRKQMLEEDDC